MNVSKDIKGVYKELTLRYNRISSVTIKNLLKGKMKVTSTKDTFAADENTPPRLAEAEDAFKRFNCAIFTAFRGGFTLEENKARNALLRVDLEKAGMAFRPVDGCYREADWEYPCIEYCYFVYDAVGTESYSFFEKVYQLSAKYDQDSFLYKRGGVNRTAFLVATTDAGRGDLGADIKFAGQLYMDVPDVEAWTDCSDGRFAFRLKGMMLMPTANRKIKLGEGDVFDIDTCTAQGVKEYNPDGIVVLRQECQTNIAESVKAFNNALPLVQHVFNKDCYPQEYIHNVVYAALKRLRDKKCRRIGFHCTASLNGSRAECAALVYETIRQWVGRYNKKIEWIVIVDTCGDYHRVDNTYE